MMLPLPIVPPAVDDELLGSWIQRTASVYDLSAHQLLDRWQVAPGPSAEAIPSVEMRVVGANAVPLIDERMRAPLQAVSAMIPEATDWIVACDADVAVCLWCLSDDDADGKPRFRRKAWAQCWRVVCTQHRVPLVEHARLAKPQTGASSSRSIGPAEHQWPDHRTGGSWRAWTVWEGRDECDHPA
jgi:hypothetical protein